MRAIRFFLMLFLVALAGSAALAATGPVITTPADTKWMPGTGGYQGLEMAVLVGDPTKSGFYIMRLKLPPGAKVPPHTHGTTENVTIVSGTLYVGVGKTADESKMSPLPAGSFVTIPADFPHYAMAKEETVLEISGMGPESITPVKP